MPELSPTSPILCVLCERRPGTGRMIRTTASGPRAARVCGACSARIAAGARTEEPASPGEPDVDETIAILDGLRPGFEHHHDAAITDEALAAAARLSDRYVPGPRLTAKALDLVDRAAARARRRTEGTRAGEAGRLRAAFVEASAAKQAAVDAEAYEAAGELMTRAEWLRARLAEVGEAVDAEVHDRPVVREIDVAEIIASRTGIPVGALLRR